MDMNRLGHTKPIGPLVAEEIRAEMARSSVTVSHLAELLDMGRSTLSKKLNWSGALTSGELDIIAKALGVTASELIRRAEVRRSEEAA